MAQQTHPFVVAVREAADAILTHADTSPKSVWRRWFEGAEGRHLLDDVKGFIRALGGVLDVPPHLLSPADLKVVGEEVERVVSRIEASLDHPDRVSVPLATAIYVIRLRYEDLFLRGATGGSTLLD